MWHKMVSCAGPVRVVERPISILSPRSVSTMVRRTHMSVECGVFTFSPCVRRTHMSAENATFPPPLAATPPYQLRLKKGPELFRAP